MISYRKKIRSNLIKYTKASKNIFHFEIRRKESDREREREKERKRFKEWKLEKTMRR